MIQIEDYNPALVNLWLISGCSVRIIRTLFWGPFCAVVHGIELCCSLEGILHGTGMAVSSLCDQLQHQLCVSGSHGAKKFEKRCHKGNAKENSCHWKYHLQQGVENQKHPWRSRSSF